MPIQMICALCGKTLSAPDTAAGKKAKCPSCGQIMVVPEVGTTPKTFIFRPRAFLPFQPAPLPGLETTGSMECRGRRRLGGLRSGGEARQPCRECGEMIIVGAAESAFVVPFSIDGCTAH